MSDEVVASLEMTWLSQLRPGREPPEPITLEKVDPSAPQLLRETYLRIWEPLQSGGRMRWSDARWTEELHRPGIGAWLGRAGGEVAGLVELVTRLA
jgi:hypothetical protein